MKSNYEKLLFRRVVVHREQQGRVFLGLRQAPIQEFQGEYIVNSTNRRLEGIHRKNWWGFAGRSSCDASLHGVYQSSQTWRDFLVTASRRALKESPHIDNSLLPFGACLVTQAGPLLSKVKKVVHTCVPRYPSDQAEPHLQTTLPHAWVASREENIGSTRILLYQCV